MAALIGLVSQKGGVGKSTLARLVAREYAAAGWQVKIADLDISQGTSTDWKQRRERAGVKPDIAVEPFGTVAHGAPAKGNTLLNYCCIGSELLEFTVDRSPHKQGMLLPGSHLSILPPEELIGRMPDYAMILPWNIAGEIVEQQLEYLRAGGRFIVPIPEPRILEHGT